MTGVSDNREFRETVGALEREAIRKGMKRGFLGGLAGVIIGGIAAGVLHSSFNVAGGDSVLVGFLPCVVAAIVIVSVWNYRSGRRRADDVLAQLRATGRNPLE